MSRRAHTLITNRLGLCVTLDPEADEALVRVDVEHRGEVFCFKLSNDQARTLAETILRALEVSA